MPIVAVFEFPGQEIAKYRKVFDAGPAILEQPQRLSHICYHTDSGFTVVDVWQDEASFAAFGAIIGPATQQAGLDARPTIHQLEGSIAQDGTRTTY
jgi:hypothetical protein